MNSFTKMQELAENGAPIRIRMIGAGKIGTMFLAQALRLKGIHLIGVVDLVSRQHS